MNMETRKDEIRTKLNKEINEYKKQIALIDEAMEKWIKGSDGKFYTKKIFNGMNCWEREYQGRPDEYRDITFSIQTIPGGYVNIGISLYFQRGTNKRVDEKKTTEETAKYRQRLSESLGKLEDEQKHLNEYYRKGMQLYEAMEKFRRERSYVFTQAMPRIY